MEPITVKELSKLLFEEFERDSWGRVDTYYFGKPPREDEGTDYDGLYEVLERVTARLNERE